MVAGNCELLRRNMRGTWGLTHDSFGTCRPLAYPFLHAVLVLKRRRPRAIARRTCPRTLCELLFLLQAADVSQRSPDHGAALSRGAQALVEALPCIAGRPPRDAFDGWPAYDQRG